MTGADLGLSKLAGSLPQSFFATVAALNDDGTVTLTWGIGSESDPILGVPASKSYVNRRATEYDDDGNVTYAGDAVLVQRVNGSLLVVGTAKSQDIDFQAMIDASLQDVQDDLDDVSDQANKIDDQVQDIYNNVIPDISYHNSAPGSGWVQADTVWYKDAGSGRVDLWLVRATETNTGSSKPTKPPNKSKTTPKPITLTPNSRGSWRPSGQTDKTVKQGTWTSLGNWRGGLFYGSSIQSAMSGKNVKSAKLTLSRAKGAGGWNRSIPCHLRLITNSSKGDPNWYGGVSSHTIKLSPGQSTTWSLPSAWVAALKSGAAKGFGVSGSGSGDYLTLGGSAGRLVLTFSKDS